MEYALIKDNKVENVIVADPDFITNIIHDWDHIEQIDTPEERALGVGIGWGWDGTQFVAPPAPEPAPEPAPTQRHISVGAFFDRFGEFKYPILSSTDASVKALIQDCSVRSYIDLDDPALPAGLEMLILAGFAVDANEVINAPIQSHELP